MNAFRKCLFWVHLISGICAGVIIAIMSLTGIAIAFESEILKWLDREVSKVESDSHRKPLSLIQLKTVVEEQFPKFNATSVYIPRGNSEAYRFQRGHANILYVNPYTGEVAQPKSAYAHDILHTLEDWHRWLGAEKGDQSFGRLITGVSNFLFLVLCISGLYLWFPRRWSTKILRRSLWFIRTQRSKARDFNFHQVFGFWSLPVLVIIVGTGVVISFNWAHQLVFLLAGEEASEYRDFRMMAVRPPEMTIKPDDEVPLGIDKLISQVKSNFPDWQAIQYHYPKDSISPIDVVVFEPAPFVTAGRVQIYLNPYSGEVLKKVAFTDRSKGLKARVWVRFLHTGEAFGLLGKIIASLATAASLVLVYTGFALAIRRVIRI